jgi:two-component system nitrogen regulation response regulator NtrX
VERLAIMTPKKVIHANDIPAPFNRETGMEEGLESSLMVDSYKEAKGHFEKAFIARKLKEFKGNISQTAEAIGIERSNLHKKIKAYGLEKIKSQ